MNVISPKALPPFSAESDMTFAACTIAYWSFRTDCQASYESCEGARSSCYWILVDIGGDILEVGGT